MNVPHTALRRKTLLAEQRALLQVEKSTLRNLFTRGEISDETLRALTADADLRLHALEDASPAGPA